MATFYRRQVVYESLRAGRSSWLATELGLPFAFDGFELNLRDLPMPSSPLQALALCRKFGEGSHLVPKTPDENAAAFNWLSWVARELDPCMLDVMECGDASEHTLEGLDLRFALDMLDKQLERKDWLMGSRFTVADLITAEALGWLRKHPSGLVALLESYPHANAWLRDCVARRDGACGSERIVNVEAEIVCLRRAEDGATVSENIDHVDAEYGLNRGVLIATPVKSKL